MQDLFLFPFCLGKTQLSEHLSTGTLWRVEKQQQQKKTPLNWAEKYDQILF